MTEETDQAPLCACGCGGFVNRSIRKGTWNTYLHAHIHRRYEPGRPYDAPTLRKPRLNYPERQCDQCGTEFTPWRKDQRFCSFPCQTRKLGRDYYLRMHDGKPPDTERKCGICEKPFPRVDRNDWRRKFCSPECQKEGKRRSRHSFHERNPEYRGKMDRIYNNGGWSSTVSKFFKRCPDVPRRCQVCGEDRVVDIHHRIPRNGVPVTAANSQKEHVWILCPNHHTMLHRGVATAETLGLA